MEGQAISQKYRDLLERIVLQDPARSEFIGRGLKKNKKKGGARKKKEFTITKCKKERAAANKECGQIYSDCIDSVQKLRKSVKKIEKEVEKIENEVKEGAGIVGGARKQTAKRPTKRGCAQGRKACRAKNRDNYNNCVRNVRDSKYRNYTKGLGQYQKILKDIRKSEPNLSYKKAQKKASRIYDDISSKPSKKVNKKSVAPKRKAVKKRGAPRQLKEFNKMVADYRMENPELSYREAQQEVSELLKDFKIKI